MKNITYKIECPEDKKVMGIVIPEKKLKSNYTRTFQDGLLEIIRDKELSGDDIRVLFGMVSQMEYENKFTMPLSHLGKKLDIARSTISKSVKKLLMKGYLVRDGSQGQVSHYMLDPRIAVRCRNSKYSKVLNQWDDLPTIH